MWVMLLSLGLHRAPRIESLLIIRDGRRSFVSSNISCVIGVSDVVRRHLGLDMRSLLHTTLQAAGKTALVWR